MFVKWQAVGIARSHRHTPPHPRNRSVQLLVIGK